MKHGRHSVYVNVCEQTANKREKYYFPQISSLRRLSSVDAGDLQST